MQVYIRIWFGLYWSRVLHRHGYEQITQVMEKNTDER